MVHRSFPIDNFLYLSLYIFLWSCFHLLPCPIYWFCKYVYLFIFFFRVLIGNKFPPLLRKRWVSPGTVHKNIICFVSDEFLITLKHNLNHKRYLNLNPIQDGPFWGCSWGFFWGGGAGQKGPSSLNSLTHMLHWWNLAQLYLI